MRKAMTAVFTAGICCLGVTSASAQGLGIYIGPPPAYGYYDYYDAPPPVYGYSSPRAERERSYRAPAGHCGTYRYWNGERCVDARNR
jgi:hypothetical protein